MDAYSNSWKFRLYDNEKREWGHRKHGKQERISIC